MTARHDLPGGWAEIRDPGEVPERLRQPVKVASARLAQYRGMRKAAEAATAAGVTDSASLAGLDEATEDALAREMGDAMGDLVTLQNLVIVSRVAAWSFSDTVTLDALLDLTSVQYDALETLCGRSSDLQEDLGPNPDPQSPTQPSAV
jgi:hypothetical protein